MSEGVEHAATATTIKPIEALMQCCPCRNPSAPRHRRRGDRGTRVGIRTRKLSQPRVLSPLRLPISPPGPSWPCTVAARVDRTAYQSASRMWPSAAKVVQVRRNATEQPARARRTRKEWRRGPESNRPTRICNPVHNRFATAPSRATRGRCHDEADSMKKGSRGFPFFDLEREKSLELSTSTLARLRSTN